MFVAFFCLYSTSRFFCYFHYTSSHTHSHRRVYLLNCLFFLFSKGAGKCVRVVNSGLKTHHNKSQIKTIKRERFFLVALLDAVVWVCFQISFCVDFFFCLILYIAYFWSIFFCCRIIWIRIRLIVNTLLSYTCVCVCVDAFVYINKFTLSYNLTYMIRFFFQISSASSLINILLYSVMYIFIICCHEQKLGLENRIGLFPS